MKCRAQDGQSSSKNASLDLRKNEERVVKKNTEDGRELDGRELDEASMKL